MAHQEVIVDAQVGAERFNLFKGCPKARTATMVLRGGSDQFIDEAERSLHDAIMIVRRAIKNAAVVAGGGAIDMEISRCGLLALSCTGASGGPLSIDFPGYFLRVPNLSSLCPDGHLPLTCLAVEKHDRMVKSLEHRGCFVRVPCVIASFSTWQ